MTISAKRTDYSNFTWERQRHGTIRILSRRTGVRYFWSLTKTWHRCDFQLMDAAEAVTCDYYDLLARSRRIPE